MALHIKKEVRYKKRCELRRAEFNNQIASLKPSDLIYIDETGIDNNISNLRGWAQKGLKSFTDALGFRTKRNTLIAGCNYGTKELIAPMKYDCYTNTEVFLSWVEHSLCKELRPWQCVIMDNASFHKSSKIKQLIELTGAALIYLPSYFPDLDPIEHVWANLKRLIRIHPDNEQNLSYAIEESIAQMFIG